MSIYHSIVGVEAYSLIFFNLASYKLHITLLGFLYVSLEEKFVQGTIDNKIHRNHQFSMKY